MYRFKEKIWISFKRISSDVKKIVADTKGTQNVFDGTEENG